MEKIYRLEFSPISSIGPFKKSVFRIYVFHILRKKSFTKYLTWILLRLTYLFRILWLVRLWCTFKRPTRCLNPYFIHIFLLVTFTQLFFHESFCFFVRLNKRRLFCIFFGCISMAKFWRRRIPFLLTTCPIIQHKKESFIFIWFPMLDAVYSIVEIFFYVSYMFFVIQRFYYHLPLFQ